ncbi:MAG: iron ABC transporter permease [Candidatus Methanomethyliaceae archaeon]|nr:iron ABC transporter permease [Candidatus Methanomethyliaceae archaeon]
MPRLRKSVFLLLLLLPLPVFFLSLTIGSYQIPFDELLAILFQGIAPFLNSDSSQTQIYRDVIFMIRLPRILLALFGGIALSVSGASLQSVFKNPLVDSYILGLSAGAGLGAALAIAFLPNIIGLTQLFAFLFSFMAFMLTYFVARDRGQASTVSLVLAGVIVTALFSAALSMIKFFTVPEKLSSVVYWLMGSMAVSGWKEVLYSVPLILLSFLIITLMRWRLNVLSMGDEEAKSLGINVERDRLVVLLTTTLMVSSFVSVAGIIGWVGLVIPHLVRMLVRTPDNRIVIPISASLGGVFLLLADDVARSLTSYELPVGVITTIIGAPFFLYLLKKRGGGSWRQ